MEVSDPLRRELEGCPIGAGEAIGGRDEIALGDLERLTLARRPAVEALSVLTQSGVAVRGYASADVGHVGAFRGELG
jgi:hypothetical protein